MEKRFKGIQFSFFLSLAVLLFLFFLTQQTKFINQISITKLGSKITFSVDGDTSVYDAGDIKLKGISATTTKSMWGRAGLHHMSIKSGGKETVYADISTVYLFGRDFSNNLIQGKYRNFKDSFGDWSSDRYRSDGVTFTSEELPQDFTLTAGFTGRGEKQLILDEDSNFRIIVHDGFMDNSMGLCIESKCPIARDLEESLSSNFLRVINFFAEVLFASLAFFFILSCCTRHPEGSAGPSSFSRATAAFFLIFILLLHAWFVMKTVNILGAIPHIPDSATFYRLAKLLSYGYLKFTPGLEPIDAFTTIGYTVSGGDIYYIYNHFWPSLISLAMFLNAEWLLNPLLSLINILLIYGVALKLFGRSTAIFSALFYAISPLGILMAGDYMNHTVTATSLLAASLLMIKYQENPKAFYAVLAGAFITYAMVLRPVTTLAFSIPTSLYFAFSYKKSLFKFIPCFAIGLIPIAALYFIDNYLTYGKVFETPYISFNKGLYSWSTLPVGMSMLDSTIGYFVSSVTSSYFSRYFLILPFLVLYNPTKSKIWLLSIFVFVVLLHAPFAAHGLHGYGARYFYESTPFLFIAAAAAVSEFFPREKFSFNFVYFAFFMTAALSGAAALNLRLIQYWNYNGVSYPLFKTIESVAKKGAIIITDGRPWQTLEMGVTIFDPELKENIFIRPLEDGSHLRVLDKLKDRPVFIATNKVERYNVNQELK